MIEERKKVAWWTDRMQEAYDKSSPASDYPNIRHKPCCEHAHVTFCVCEISFLCPYHGGKCHGSHN